MEKMKISNYINKNNLNQFIKKLLEDGIVFEYEFGLSSVILENVNDIEEFLMQNEYSINISCACEVVEDNGWMYALYNSDKYDLNEAKELIEQHFKNK